MSSKHKTGDDFAPYHPNASHIEPGYRDGWNACYKMAEAEIERLRAELERERMRLAACGVVADANTQESAAKAREMHDEYHSASCDAVARTVDREMQLRAERDALKEDAERLASIAWPVPLFDKYYGIALHEEASIYASALGRDEPNRDDYLAALRSAIDDAQRKEQK